MIRRHSACPDSIIVYFELIRLLLYPAKEISFNSEYPEYVAPSKNLELYQCLNLPLADMIVLEFFGTRGKQGRMLLRKQLYNWTSKQLHYGLYGTLANSAAGANSGLNLLGHRLKYVYCLNGKMVKYDRKLFRNNWKKEAVCFDRK